MATTGAAVVNGVTGERIVRQTLAGETAGALVSGDGFLPYGVGVPGMHLHPDQEA